MLVEHRLPAGQPEPHQRLSSGELHALPRTADANGDSGRELSDAGASLAQASFADFARLGERLAATGGRRDRAGLIAAYLGGLDPDAAAVAARLLLGRAFPAQQGRRLSLGGAAIGTALELAGVAPAALHWTAAPDFGQLVAEAMPAAPLAGPPLTLADLHDAFTAIAATAGAGARGRRLEQLAALFRRAAPLEGKYLAKVVVGEMRHGVQEGTVLDALAALAGAAPAVVRRALQARGDVGVLAALLRRDPAALAAVRAELFQPIKPMLAQAAADVAAAWQALDGRLALQWKLDGARVQIHKRGDEVRIFSRRLQELTPSLPEIVAAVRERAAAAVAVFEGEVLAVAGERPLPFQELMRRFRRVREVAAAAREVPVRLYLFDLLQSGEALLLERPFGERWTALAAARGGLEVVAHLQPDSPQAGEAFYREALAAGHEGVMAKALDSPYTPGVRGAAWLKVKHSVTFDLVIIAADWGYGRRHGWLSNYHLAARDPASGALTPVGKTFKGPTDAGFAALTTRLLALEQRRAGGTVHVRPEVVVEVRVDGVQTSSLYPGGLALRFARIVGVRDDKRPADADTLDALRRLRDR